MLIDTNVVKSNEGREFYDMFSLSQVVLDLIKGKEQGCSIMDGEVIHNCDLCPVSGICRKLNGFIGDMKKAATVVEQEFNFQ